MVSPGSRVESGLKFLPTEGLEDRLKEMYSVPYTYAAKDFYPIMSQISPFKEQYISLFKIHEIRKRWSEAVTSASLVIIIGVRYQKDDVHIIEPIRKTQAKIFYIGDEESFSDWEKPTASVYLYPSFLRTDLEIF